MASSATNITELTETPAVTIPNDPKDIIDDDIIGNRYEVLGDSDNSTVEPDMETDKTKDQKRNLDHSSPPLKKKPAVVKDKPSTSVEESMPAVVKCKPSSDVKPVPEVKPKSRRINRNERLSSSKSTDNLPASIL